MQVPVAVRDVTRKIGAWLRGLPPFVIVAIGWGVGMLYAYPGLMSLDSMDQLNEARTGIYTDSHPPAMAALWRIVDSIIAGPVGMLVLHTVAFVAGAYLLLKRALPARGAALATALVFVFPPVLAPLSAIWKDCIMAGFFLLGTAGLLAERRWLRVVGLLCLVVATAVRYNAPAATLPLIVLLFKWFDATTLKQKLARYALATGAWIAVTAVGLGIDVELTDIHMHFWQSSLAILDIAGTLAHVDETIPDDQLRETFAGTQLLVDKDIHAAFRSKYRPTDFDPLISGDGHLWNLPIQGQTPAPEPQRDAIARAFWELATAHPGAYLRHRMAVMADVLALTPTDGMVVITNHVAYRDYMVGLGLATKASHMQMRWQYRVLRLSQMTPLFRPFIYLVLALVLLALCRDRDVLALLLSGLGLESSLILLAPTSDYRYSHWLVTCSLLGAIMVTARRLRARRERSGAATRGDLR